MARSFWYHLVCACFHSDPSFWNQKAKAELDRAVNHNTPIVGVARNVILFLGDGMGVPTVTAARILQGQMQGKNGEEHQLSFDKFPHVALSKASTTCIVCPCENSRFSR